MKPIIYLAFANPKNDLHHLTSERKAIKDIFDNSCISVEHESSTDLDDIFGVFHKFNKRIAILHFAGHADFSFLTLENTKLKGKTLQTLIHHELNSNPHSLGLVFLNGCNTWGQVKTLWESGVKCIVATNKEINDELAKNFATKLYQQLINEKTIEDSFKFAKAYVNNETNANWSELIGIESVKNEVNTYFEWGLYLQNEDCKNWSLKTMDLPKEMTCYVLASTKDKVIANIGEDRFNLFEDKNRYHDSEISLWKPFYQEKNISSILEDLKVDYPIKIEYLDEDLDNIHSINIEDNQASCIGIIDLFSINGSNKDFAKCFDSNKVNIILPQCRKLINNFNYSEDLRKNYFCKLQKRLSYLGQECLNYSYDVSMLETFIRELKTFFKTFFKFNLKPKNSALNYLTNSFS